MHTILATLFILKRFVLMAHGYRINMLLQLTFVARRRTETGRHDDDGVIPLSGYISLCLLNGGLFGSCVPVCCARCMRTHLA